jgi:hypothetical protein
MHRDTLTVGVDVAQDYVLVGAASPLRLGNDLQHRYPSFQPEDRHGYKLYRDSVTPFIIASMSVL